MSTIAWGAGVFGAYVAFLAWAGRASAGRGASFASFAAGRTELGAVATGFVTAACLASTATFAISPGFVYRHGLSAFIAFSAPVAAGVAAAFALLGERFRETSIGPDGQPRLLTLPQWIGARFDSEGLRRLFAALLLALFAYVVLVVVGAAYVVAEMLRIPPGIAATGLVAVVLAGSLGGGASAHARINAVQGALLVGAALVLGGFSLFRLLAEGGAGLARLRAADPALFAPFRADAPLFSDGLDVIAYPLAIGFALGCQPHILGKALFVRERGGVARTGLASAGFFLAISLGALLVGFAARADLGAGLPQDRVASVFVASAFAAPLAALVSLALVIAGTSTLDGLLLALGATLAHDVARPLLARAAATPAQVERRALLAGRIATVGIGALAAAVAFDPPRLVWITGASGVYALVAAACPAVVAGCLDAPRASARWIAAAAVAGPAVHGLLYGLGASANPNATGAAGVAAGLAVALVGHLANRVSRRVTACASS